MNHPVRQAALDDIPLLVDLMDEFYAESSFPLDREHAARAFRRLLRDPARGAVWLLQADSETAGYVVLCVGFSMEYGGLDAFVDDLYVRPRFRGQGLAHMALTTLFAECQERGVRAVHVEVGRDNLAAKSLYAQFGFRDNDRQLLTVGLPANSNVY